MLKSVEIETLSPVGCQDVDKRIYRNSFNRGVSFWLLWVFSSWLNDLFMNIQMKFFSKSTLNILFISILKNHFSLNKTFSDVLKWMSKYTGSKPNTSDINEYYSLWIFDPFQPCFCSFKWKCITCESERLYNLPIYSKRLIHSNCYWNG